MLKLNLNSLVTFTLISLLTACSQKQVVNEIKPTYQIVSGAKVDLGNGNHGVVFGYDNCRQDRGSLYGNAIGNEKKCVQLDARPTVKVRIILNDGSIVIEKWSVDIVSIDKKETYQIKRANNLLVSQVKQGN
tara:strand:+ start:951 stop:1346 length:396 start_codon:yes stop_codon:yes gene_type:complete